MGKKTLFIVFLLISSVGIVLAQQTTGSYSPQKIDYKELVSRSDIKLKGPVSRSEGGLPIGNGTMGSLVWTTPSSLRFQINRVDVYASNKGSKSFNARGSDYCNGLGYVDIDFSNYDKEVFTDIRTRQHLNVYDAVVSVDGDGIKTKTLVWHDQDVMAIYVEDQRPRPTSIKINLRMLRPAIVNTKQHTVVSELFENGSDISLTQTFTEGDYYNKSVVTIGVEGRESITKFENESTLSLLVAPGQGAFTLFISSASSFSPEEDTVSIAQHQIDKARKTGFDNIFKNNKNWWHSFWAKGHISMHSTDGEADFIQKNYNYFLYLMASSSRGKYPPKFNGMLWNTAGDKRQWGAQHWGYNLLANYLGLLPTNRFELVDSMFNMYSNMYGSVAMAAKQQWKSKGIWIPEVISFDGITEMPEDIAEELSNLYLLKKPWESRSQRFNDYAATGHPNNSRWNWRSGGDWKNGKFSYKSKNNSPYGHCTHIFSIGAKIAWNFWLRYEYTKDKNWLRERAYPILKGVAEFYRNFQSVRKDVSGKYHIHDTNNQEDIWGVQDAIYELTSMYGILPLAIKASEVLDVDADMRPLWKELLNNLTPLPTNENKASPEPRKSGEPVLWVKALGPIANSTIKKEKGESFINTIPALYYDIYTLESENLDMAKITNDSYDFLYANKIDEQTPVKVLSMLPVTAALMGRSKDIEHLLPNQIKVLDPAHDFVGYNNNKSGVLENRMTLREGVQALGCQRLGLSAFALHNALLQSVPPNPGEEPIIRVFPAWPEEWDVDYALATRGTFIVSSSMKNGTIEYVKIHSRNGEKCLLRDPWGNENVTLYHNGKKAESIQKELMLFKTE